MKKQIMTLTALITMATMSGCTQQVATPNPNSRDNSDATMVSSDTVSLDTKNNHHTNNSKNHKRGAGANSIYFGYDSNNIKAKGKNKIKKDAQTLKSKKSGKVKIEGNSDEFGTDEYNYALGLRRAKAVKDSMVAKGVPEKKISIVSYGESNPVCKDGTKKCYQKNRRADYK